MNKQEIEQLFSVGDTLKCANENVLSVAAILEDRILLRSAAGDAGEIGVDYGAIAEKIEGGAEKDTSPLGCFVSEYQRRAQIRHEERVDELWDSAAELFLGPVCSMPELTPTGNMPLCPLDASFFLNRR